VRSGPTLFVHLVVLGLVGLRIRLRVLVEIWVLTTLPGMLVIWIAPEPVTSPDLAEVSILTARYWLPPGRCGRRWTRGVGSPGPAGGTHPDRPRTA
jgi:hypothetical protein